MHNNPQIHDFVDRFRDRFEFDAKCNVFWFVEEEEPKKIEPAVAPAAVEQPRQGIPALPASIIRDVADWHALSVQQMMAKDRTNNLVFARQEAMYLLRHCAKKYSLGQIGRFMGGMHHTSVLHGVKQYGGI